MKRLASFFLIAFLALAGRLAASTPPTISGDLSDTTNAIALDVSQRSAASFQLSGTWAATVVLESTLNGTNWENVPFVDSGRVSHSAGTTVNGIYTAQVSSQIKVRVRASAFTSGDVETFLSLGNNAGINTNSVVVEGTSDTIGVFSQGPAGLDPWLVTDAATHTALLPLTLTAHISDTLDAILASSAAGDITTIGGTTVANQGPAPGFMPSFLSAYNAWSSQVETLQTHHSDSTFNPNTRHSELLVANQQIAIGETAIANQSNAPGWMPMALGDGYGDPIDSQIIGNNSLGGLWGIAVNSATADGYGELVGSTVLDGTAADAETRGLNTASMLQAIDSFGTVPGALYGATPGDWQASNSLPSGGMGLIGVMSLDALGGGVLSTAWDLGTGSDGTSGITVPRTLSVLAAYDDGYAGFTGLTNTYDSNTDKTSLDSAVTTWGQAGVSAADFYGSLANTPNPDTASLSLAPVFSMLGANDQAGSYDTAEGALAVSGQYIHPGQNEDDIMQDGNGIFAADVAGHVATWGFAKVAPADANGAISVSDSSTNPTDTYTTAVPGTNRVFNGQNYTWQVGSDDPLSIGLAFSITLEVSIDGGTRWQVIDTKTEADVSSAPTTIQNKPGAIFRTNCGSLTLGATATNVNSVVLAK